ncbi:MAG: aconitase family protein [candidate division Zixibacteria bacterium]|nr:aconitase family protein [candidate division Zixibacteria bacterium]
MSRIPNKTQLVELQKKYKTHERIGEALGGVPAYLVSYWMRKKSVPKISEPKFSRYQIQSLWEETGSDAKAGGGLGISKAAFYRWRRVYGLTERPKVLKLHQLDLGIGSPRREAYRKSTVLEQVLTEKLKGKELQVGEKVEIFPDRGAVWFSPEELPDWPEVERPYPVNLFEFFNPLTRSGSGTVRGEEKIDGRVLSAGDGVFHQLLFEQRLPRPFELVGIAGHHHTALSGFGALVFPTERERLAEGYPLSLTIPKVYQVVLTGELPFGTTVADLVLLLQNRIPPHWNSHSVVEFLGEGVDCLSPEERFGLANLAGELHLQTVLVAAQMPVEKEARIGDWKVERLEFDLSNVDPGVCHYPQGLVGEPLSGRLGWPVERVFIGGCQSGNLEDLETVARLLENRMIDDGVELSIFPASRTVYRKALRKGVLDTLVGAGAYIFPPGSSPVSWSGKIFATTDRACLEHLHPQDVWTGSFLTGLAAALTGKLTDPRSLFR